MHGVKGDFLNIYIFLVPSDSRYSNSCISAKYYNKPCINGNIIQIVYTYNWFCDPGSHIVTREDFTIVLYFSSKTLVWSMFLV